MSIPTKIVYAALASFVIVTAAKYLSNREKLTADQLYGCTVAQRAPSGECK